MNFVMKEDAKTHSTSMIYYGSAVIGLKYNKGIIIACDTSLNYGSMSAHKSIKDKVERLNNSTIIGYSGEYSDKQESSRILKELILQDQLSNTNILGPKEISNYLSSVHYYKRNKMDPYLNQVVMGGIDWDNKPILYLIDHFGTHLEADYFTTGLANYFCHSIISPLYPAKYQQLTKEDAIKILEKCYTVLFCRDSGTTDSVMYASIEKKDNDIEYNEGTIKINSKWDFESFKNFGNEKHYLIS